ncbi:hypothetical protein RFI_25672, partial [Reticulomyxa filosa]
QTRKDIRGELILEKLNRNAGVSVLTMSTTDGILSQLQPASHESDNNWFSFSIESLLTQHDTWSDSIAKINEHLLANKTSVRDVLEYVMHQCDFHPNRNDGNDSNWLCKQNENGAITILGLKFLVEVLFHRSQSDVSLKVMQQLDECLEQLDSLGFRWAVTSAHGSSDKLDAKGNLKVIHVASIIRRILDQQIEEVKSLECDVIAVGTDHSILNPSSPHLLTSFLHVYIIPKHDFLWSDWDHLVQHIMKHLRTIRGVYTVLGWLRLQLLLYTYMCKEEAVKYLDLPEEMTGDIVICGDIDTVFDVDTHNPSSSSITYPFGTRSFGGLDDSMVPMLINEIPTPRYTRMLSRGKGRNFYLWDILLNGFDPSLQDLCTYEEKPSLFPYIGK